MIKAFIVIIFLVYGCASIDPIQVYREPVEAIRIEVHGSYPLNIYHIIWQDRRGIEYTEEVMDTTGYYRSPKTFYLLKR